ncbi:hypothetical protein AB0C07_17610 [Actinoplanes missouriensis]|uniref:hypothetical protein n=1 Tax=Actinoplanes missouriensis TaxID=1866 RepID=UPI0033CD0761
MLLGDRPGARRRLGPGQFRAGVQAEGDPGGPHVGEALQGALPGQAVLGHRPGLAELGAGGLVPFGRVDERLPGQVPVVAQVEQLAAQSFVPAVGVGAGVGEDLVPASRATAAVARDQGSDAGAHQKQKQQNHHVIDGGTGFWAVLVGSLCGAHEPADSPECRETPA